MENKPIPDPKQMIFESILGLMTLVFHLVNQLNGTDQNEDT